jgi:hypothetical protein
MREMKGRRGGQTGGGSERGERIGCNPGEIQIQAACSYCSLDGVKYRENDLTLAQQRQHQLSDQTKRRFSLGSHEFQTKSGFTENGKPTSQ